MELEFSVGFRPMLIASLCQQSAAPKRVKTKIKAPTQAELIARALDMEEGNIEEHRNYLTLEEEKRKKARVVRTSVQGPLIRWISKKEEMTVLVQPPAPSLPHPPASVPPLSQAGNQYAHYRYHPPPSPSAASPNATRAPYANTLQQHQSTPYTPGPYTPSQSGQYYTPPTQNSPPYAPHAAQSSFSSQSSPFPQWPPPPPPPAYTPAPQTTSTSPGMPTTQPVQGLPSTPASTPMYAPSVLSVSLPPPPIQPVERKETVSKQYVVHEIDQTEKPTRPNWSSTMTAMFGDHVDWESARVYTAKGRPFGESGLSSVHCDDTEVGHCHTARPTQTCPITGKIAKYLDPRTNVPYADLGAYRVLNAVLRHEYVWSPGLGCYVSREGSLFAQSGT